MTRALSLSPDAAALPPAGDTRNAPADSHALLHAGECPLCRQANQCAVAQGLDPSLCWCMQAVLDPAALARIPASAQSRQCLCPQCGAPTAVRPKVPCR